MMNRLIAAGRLRALVGGDARYGGLNDPTCIAPSDQRDSVVARFAVVRRARQVAPGDAHEFPPAQAAQRIHERRFVALGDFAGERVRLARSPRSPEFTRGSETREQSGLAQRRFFDEAARSEYRRPRSLDRVLQRAGPAVQSPFAGAGAVAGRAVFSASSSMPTSASRL